MANNRKTTRGRKGQIITTIILDKKANIMKRVTGIKQIIYSEPRRILVERYLSPKGTRLLKTKEITKKEVWEKYGKNRYALNVNAKPVKVIAHVNN